MLLFGTSSWSEKSWVGPFYPGGTKPAEMITHYASRFPTVEIDSTYYAVPAPRVTQGWARKTPDGFIFSAKFTRTIVHGGESATPDPSKLLKRDVVGKDTDDFLAAMGELGPKCGPLVLQFPFFNRRCFASAAPFLERLDGFLGTLPPTFRYAVEVRNRDWLGAPLLDILKRHRAALVLVDIVNMPHPADLVDILDIVTTDFVYGRLIGDRHMIDAITSSFDKIVVDMQARLERWAALLKLLQLKSPKIYLYANNHYAGYAPTTIEMLRELTGKP